MYLARFLETTYEQKYAKRHDRYLCEDNWYVAYPTFGHRRRDESEEVRLLEELKKEMLFSLKKKPHSTLMLMTMSESMEK